MGNKRWGKIFCEEGVLQERQFETDAEALAYCLGASDAIDLVDPEDDFHDTGVGEEPAKDDPADAPAAPDSSGMVSVAMYPGVVILEPKGDPVRMTDLLAARAREAGI